ncbi:MAG: LCP family protein [Actinobacteria bacterium]|nr:LCP family protein [Actinomycetota bacterium]
METAEGFELKPSFKRRHTNAQRAVMVLNVVVVIACLAGAGALLFGKNALDNTLATEQVDIVTSTASPTIPPLSTAGSSSTTAGTVPVTFPPADPFAVNFLIVGSDANACVDPNSRWAGAADPTRESLGSRSDSIMLMRVDPTTNQAAVLSFPRDLWVKVGNSSGRINSAYVENDYTLLAQTLYDNFEITVDHYLQVDFCAFKQIVDAVGGVTVPFKTRIVDTNVNLDVPAGCHTFSGDEALAYVRSRHLKWVDDNGVKHEDRAADFGRIARQQDFLRRVLQGALAKGIYDPAVAQALIESLQNYIVRDSGLLAIDEILSFAGVMRDIEPTGIRTYQIESTALNVAGNSVRKPSLKGDNMKAILAIFQGTAALAGSPEQVFETTTVPAQTTGATTGPTTPTATATTTTLVSEPDENILGDIVPDETVQC